MHYGREKYRDVKGVEEVEEELVANIANQTIEEVENQIED